VNADERIALDLAAPGSRPFDAWTVVADEPEPWGSHATPDAALEALGDRGGAVTHGLTFLRWHPGTAPEAKRLLREALQRFDFDRYDEAA